MAQNQTEHLKTDQQSVWVLSTLGNGSNEENRIKDLCSELSPHVFPFDRRMKWRSLHRLMHLIRTIRPGLIVLEGTGLAGGVPLILGRLLFGQRYIVSSGDAVGPWVSTKSRLLSPLFTLYERTLCRYAAGFIGWTPYLVGRALTFGCPRAMTAAGWAPFTRTAEQRAEDRAAIRKQLGIAPETIVVGIAGSLVWSKKRNYCYGWELINAAKACNRDDVCWLIVGDGDGKDRLESAAKEVKRGQVIFTGRIPQQELPAYLAAMDIGSLPQSVDQVGSFRYTTKVSEYLAFHLPFITGEIPLSYDFPSDWLWRLPGSAPWDAGYIHGLADLIESLSHEQIEAKRSLIPSVIQEFDRDTQVERVKQFIGDLLDASAPQGR
jgi:glycosyltransferase involved in cell wall biosynthesis